MILKSHAEEVALIAQEIGAEGGEEKDRPIRDVEEWLRGYKA